MTLTTTAKPDLLDLIAKGPLVAPGAFDGLSAKLVEQAGFPVIYVGSYGTAASAGLGDVGLLSLDELVAHAKKVVGVVNVPVIADAEGGFHDPGNLWRTVHAFEDAGVCAIHIEDHAGGKHADVPQKLIPLPDMLARLQAAMDARRDPSFRIIARTDAIWALGDEVEARRRLEAFAELGVDLVFPTGASLDFVASVRRPGMPPVVVIETPDSEPFSKVGGADLILYYGFCLYAASLGMQRALADFKQHGDSARLRDQLEPVADFERRFGYDDFTRRSKRYAIPLK